MIKNVLLIAYTKANVGDDLFISMITKKYPNINFSIYVENIDDAFAINNITNLTIINKKFVFDTSIIQNYDSIIYIGGSLFIEAPNSINRLQTLYDFVKEAKALNVPFFYMGTNFGPYKTEEYLNLTRNVLKTVTHTCFRDKYSFDIFSDLNNVSLAPDIVFGLDINDTETIKKSIGISMIDLKKKSNLQHVTKDYLKCLANNIKKYIDDGYSIYLFPFCDAEGDVEACNNLIEILPDSYSAKINIVDYNSSLDDFMNIYSKMEFMICSRFHSMILSSKLGHKFIVLSYSNKLLTVVNDTKITSSYINLENITSDDLLDINSYQETNSEIINSLSKDSAKHFNSFNKLIK